MLFISVDDFLAKVNAAPRLTPEEEKSLAYCILDGDDSAQQTLLQSYIPLVASFVRRAPTEIRTLHTVYACIDAVKKGMEHFNFLQSNRPFAHYVNWHLRQCITRCIADRF